MDLWTTRLRCPQIHRHRDHNSKAIFHLVAPDPITPYPPQIARNRFYQQPSRQDAEAFLKRWYFWATHSRLQPMIDAARTVKRHWDGILRWHDTHIANGILEGINSLVQAAKAKARGYRSSHNLKAMIYLIAGKLEILRST